ncbi:MAG TPA: single-stranded-DNA-specific exonuclease RecJ [Polyangiaceae bacterium]|nr:single-stranded-DNA-specific exonuclease RecJ [Polyangiaceae bacterium]
MDSLVAELARITALENTPDYGAELPPPAGAAASALAARLGKTLTVCDWLAQRGFAEAGHIERFLNPKLSELTLPDAMRDRAAAAERLARAVRAGERVVVFGDYDCDGMTATAILTEILRALGGNVTPLLASRFDGGYGLSAAALQRVLAAKPSLVVTCDCGSSDHASLRELRSAGVDCIVVDHHLVPDEPLPALAFLNPHRPDCGFAYKGLASCGLVLSLGAALRAALNPKLDLRQWLDLVAIGTIADVAPLDGDNRALVRAGLRSLAEPKRPGLFALMQLAKLEPGTPLTSEDIAFRLAPRLNAPGRLGSPETALELMLARDANSAELLAAQLEQASQERKAQQEQMTTEALEEIEREGYADRRAIVLGREGWNHGIVGIVAGRLSERFRRPVVVFGFTQGHGRGSVRGPSGARLHDALSLCVSTVLRFGGHQAAAGVEVELSRLAEFRAAFEAAVLTTTKPETCASTAIENALWLAPSDDPSRVFAELSELEPCGLKNPSPWMLVEGKLVLAREVTGGHLKLELEVGRGRRISGFGVNLGQRAAGLGERVLVGGRLRRDRYRGGDAVELFVERIF